MIRIFLLFLFVINLFAENIEIFGSRVYIKNNIVYVENGLLIRDNIIVSANTIIYNKLPLKKNIIAKGNVYINYKNNILLGNSAYINLDTNKIKLTPFFMFSLDTKNWISGKYAIDTDNSYYINNMITSTCNPNKPDWKIVASSAKYNKKTKWVDLYNPTLYLGDLPILYLPYLGFSEDKTRRSGFLRPTFGFSGNEGLLFTLPYYQIFGNTADLELDPTIRTMRGKGIYSTFRFVHSPTSYGEIKAGEFVDKKYYQDKYNLKYKKHIGWSFLYKNRNILGNDKLYVDIKNANDVDYFYLDAHNSQFNKSYLSNKILVSRLNYFNIYNDNYFGLYSKYFKDTTKDDNSDTMQLLPQLQYHKFSKTLFNNFLYSIDYNLFNYTRKKGYKAFKQSLYVPISYQINFFNDYLKFNIKEVFDISKVTERGDGVDNVVKYYTNDTHLKLYSLLSKKYKTFSHHLVPSLTYSFNNKTYTNDNKSDYINTTKTKKNVKFNLEQYMIGNNFSIYHSLSQVYYLDNNSTNHKSDLFNVFNMNIGNFYINENNRYSFILHKNKYNSFTFGYNNGKYKLETRHTYSYKNSETLDFNGFYNIGYYRIMGDYNYDLKLNLQKYYILGLSMHKKCWNYSISFKREIVPILTNNGISGIIRKTIYLQIEFIPLGGLKQQYQFKDKKVN